MEPDFETPFSNVTLIREGGRESEQTFAVKITVRDPTIAGHAATLDTGDVGQNYDYKLTSHGSFITIPFPSESSFITFSFFLNSDELFEGLEAFQATLTPVDEGFPAFQPPVTNTAYQTTKIQIIDNDCELLSVFKVMPKYY